AVQGRRPVQQNGVFANDFVENIPHHGFLGFHQALGRLDGGGQTHHFETIEDEGLEQLQCHELGQTALVQLELGPDHNHGTTEIVYPLAQQVLTEASAFTLDHVGQGLELSLVGARHGLATTTVVQQRIHGLLQHALFVAQNDVGCLELDEALQAVVAVDDATVEVVEIRGGKTTAIQRYQWPQLGREHGQHFHDHPVGLDA